MVKMTASTVQFQSIVKLRDREREGVSQGRSLNGHLLIIYISTICTIVSTISVTSLHLDKLLAGCDGAAVRVLTRVAELPLNQFTPKQFLGHLLGFRIPTRVSGRHLNMKQFFISICR